MKAFGKNKKGQALVEFAMTFGLYTALMLMAFDFAAVAYQWTILQYSANAGARIGSLGYINDIDPNHDDKIFSSGTNQTFVDNVKEMSNTVDRIDTIKSVVVLQARKFGVAITKNNVRIYDEDYAQLYSGDMQCSCDDPNKATKAAKVDTVGEKLMYVRAEKDITLPVLSSAIQSLLGFFDVTEEIKCHLVGEALTRNEPFTYKAS